MLYNYLLITLMSLYIFTNINVFYGLIALTMYPMGFLILNQYIENQSWTKTNDIFTILFGYILLCLNILFKFIKIKSIIYINKYKHTRQIQLFIKTNTYLYNKLQIQNNKLKLYCKLLLLKIHTLQATSLVLNVVAYVGHQRVQIMVLVECQLLT